MGRQGFRRGKLLVTGLGEIPRKGEEFFNLVPIQEATSGADLQSEK
jgi:hypothetical protein